MYKWLAQLLWGWEIKFTVFRLRVTGADKIIQQVEANIEYGKYHRAQMLVNTLRRRCGETPESARLQTRIDIGTLMGKPAQE